MIADFQRMSVDLEREIPEPAGAAPGITRPHALRLSDLCAGWLQAPRKSDRSAPDELRIQLEDARAC